MGVRFWNRRTVRAREFILEDNQGRERASLRTDKADNTLLVFRGPGGDMRMHMGVTSDGTPRVTLHCPDNKGRVELEANARLNSATLLVSSSDGEAGIAVAITPNGIPAIVIFDRNGKPVFVKCGISPASETLDEESFFDWNTLLRDEAT